MLLFPLFNVRWRRGILSSAILAVIEKSMVPCVYYIFNDYLLIDYMARNNFTTSLFYQHTARELFILRFSLVPGREEMAYLKVLTKDR